jgi:putative membrane protein
MLARRKAAIALTAAALGAGPALAAAPAPASAPARVAQAPIPDITDAQFLQASAIANLFEIRTGQIAAKRGRTAVVRRLGRQFVQHHRMALAQGAVVAKKLGVPVPTALDPANQAVVNRLRTIRRSRFDAAWLRAQLKAHEASILLHLRGAINGDTPDVRTLAILALPVIGTHQGELVIASQHRHHH